MYKDAAEQGFSEILTNQNITSDNFEAGFLNENAPEVTEASQEVELSERQVKLLSDLEVSLALEVGNISVSAETLLGLEPGSRLQLQEESLAENALITLSGEPVAKGRLVSDENGQLAVEIIQLLDEIQSSNGR